MFVDYWKFNDKMVKNVYPIPRIDENLDALGGAKWFTTFDCDMASQVPLEEKDKQKKNSICDSNEGFVSIHILVYTSKKISRASENVHLYENKQKKVKQTISHKLL